MKTIRLNRLSLNNFKGFTFTLRADGADVDIFGQNASGKTTIADAFSWLLFDKDSLGRSDFDIKNLNDQGEAEHGRESSVEGILEVDGVPVTLSKVHREIWTKKRGNAKAVFAGNTTDYFINSVPVQKKDYVGWVADMAGDESRFRLLTSPAAFPALHWTKQRELLMDVCGNVTDTEVIESDPRLAPLIEILGTRFMDDHKKVIAARKTEINKELDRIPVRIDEVKRGLPDVMGLDRSKLTSAIAGLEMDINDAKLRLQGVDNGGNIAELSKKLAGIDNEIAKLERDHFNDTMKEVTKLNQKVNEVNEAKAAHERKSKSLSDQITDKKDLLPTIETKLDNLRARWSEIDAETFEDSTETICPACKQPLPSDRVEEAREKALAEFNRKKAERLTDIEEEGRGLSKKAGDIRDEIEKLHKELLELPSFQTIYNVDELTTKRDELKKKAEDYSSLPNYVSLRGDKSHVESDITAAKGSVSVDRDAIRKEINDLDLVLGVTKADLDKFTRRETGNSRIQELKNSEKVLATEFEKLEGELFLCEEFIKTKVRMLTDRINSKFEIARFKLFETQVNGGITECCEIIVNGIGYNSNLNSAGRINAGLDVCRTLSRHYGLLPPIFVDNAETVCKLVDMDTQVVRLVVSEPDKVLRIETAKTAAKAA